MRYRLGAATVTIGRVDMEGMETWKSTESTGFWEVEILEFGREREVRNGGEGVGGVVGPSFGSYSTVLRRRSRIKGTRLRTNYSSLMAMMIVNPGRMMEGRNQTSLLRAHQAETDDFCSHSPSSNGTIRVQYKRRSR